jgi:ribonuclease T1
LGLSIQGYPVISRGSAGSALVESTRNLHQARNWCVGIATVVLAVAGLGLVGEAGARGPEKPGGLAEVALSTLPPEARTTHRLILSGGPFPYDKDGVVFGNRERLLPSKARGFYREYTVKTPGSRDRGARRIVCGGKPPTQPEVCYYTADHYASFRRISP